MRSRFLFYIFLFLLSSPAIGCYDDEGNYDYKTINEVAVKLEETYGVRKVDTVFVIRPEIRQSLATDTTNLKFEWYYNSASDQFKGDLVSTADTVAIRIDPADKKFSYNHYLRFYIHDTQKEDPDPGCHVESQQKLQDNLDDRPVINKDRSVKL